MNRITLAPVALIALLSSWAVAGVGDPQTMTNHEWFPGELSSSTFPRLFATQAALYERVTGRKADNDEDKALASWYWRNINYFHSTIGGEDIFGAGWKPTQGGEDVREYWSGLYGYGYGLCFTTHHQWAGEMEKLLGPGRSRAMGVQGHTTFEVWLKGGEYGDGKWVLLDHDISTVVFTKDGKRLAGLTEVSQNIGLVKEGDRSRGWLPSGLAGGDTNAYKGIKWSGYSTGYAAVPPMVYLRSGETLRRYVDPGLEDGQTYVYWGINYGKGGIGGPNRDRTWCTKPDKMFKTTKDAGGPGLARYGNAVYTYVPDFKSGGYKEGVVEETDSSVTFEWYSPYIIGATPPEAHRAEQWAIMQPGCTNGLVIKGTMTCPVEISVDQGKTWKKAETTKDGMDLTDLAKGQHQYLLRFGAGAKDLADKGVTITTIAQCAQTVVPHVAAGKNTVTYESSGHAYLAAGPNKAQAAAHVVEGAIDGNAVTLKLAAPRQAKTVAVYGAFHAASGNPPKPSKFNIECSADEGKTWESMLKDWQITSRQPEPGDYWSQTLCGGDATLKTPATGPVQVRFSNTEKCKYLRAEAQIVYEVPNTSPLKVTYAWKEGGAEVKTAEHTYDKSEPGKADATWTFDAGTKPQTFYVEYSAK